MKKTVTWVLIADGAQARVLENTGPGKGLKQVEGLDWSIEPLQAQDIVTDRPGSKSGGGAMAAACPQGPTPWNIAKPNSSNPLLQRSTVTSRRAISTAW